MRTLHDVGEKLAVAEILSRIGSSGAIGLGDDAAAIEIGNRYLVITTDMISKRTHMPDCMSSYQVGWMATAVNLSDIAAMGASPLGLVMAMGLPRELPLDDVMKMTDGIRECVAASGMEYLGGDTKECPELTLTGTALGMVRKDGILLRSAARPGDLIAVTGTIGLAGAALVEIELDEFDPRAREAMLEPRPRLKEGTILSASGVVGACIDTSDGLAMSLYELARASGCGFLLDHDKIPIDPGAVSICERHGLDPDEVTLFSGGDYQLLFTIRLGGLERLRGMLGDDFTVIGRIVPGNGRMLSRNGHLKDLPEKGYVHFIG
jgi:thiamine-monophosphate kinase